jgi:hypothetical protein
MITMNSTLAHDGRPSNWPFCTIFEACPNIMAVVRLRAVDGAYRKPNDENNNDHDVEHGTHEIDPPDELGALHSNESLNK